MAKPDIRSLASEIKESFGLTVESVTPLQGYDSRNFRVTAREGEFLLKTFPETQRLCAELSAESRVLEVLIRSGIENIQQPVADGNGAYVFRITIGNEQLLAQLFRFLEGGIVGSDGLRAGHLEPLGELLANIGVALSGVHEPAIEARISPWDLRQWRLSVPSLKFIEDPGDRKYVEFFFRRASELVDPQIPFLRQQIIHGDANEWNVIAGEDEKVSLIDFGDMCFSPLVNEVAIAACYVILQSDDPVAGATPLLRAYSSVNPLEEKEIALLYDLIAIRACISVCRSARARTEMPDNEYAQISDPLAWAFLRRWVSISPRKIENAFREAFGFEPLDPGSLKDDLKVRRANTSSALSLQFDEPIRMESAAFQYMFDAEGNSYLDCYNNIPHVGHCHPRIVEALASASLKINTNTRYLTREFNDYSSRLLGYFPERLNKVFFVNSGSAATDLALRLAHAHTNAEAVIVAEHGYHGNTRAGIAVSHYKYAGRGGTGRDENVIEAPIPNILREGDADRDFFEELRMRIEKKGTNPSAFIAEPIVGCGGQVPLPVGYLPKVYEYVRSRGGVCISDEVQTGFGRLGNWFWGFEMHGVEPDIVILGKPMGNGHPMAAVVTTSGIASSFETGMEFFSSFGGNTVSCAVGSAVLDVIETEGLQENAAEVGGQLLTGLQGLVRKFEECAEARGAGLFLGLELVEPGTPARPATELASRVKNRLKERGILVGTDGPHDNVIKIKPPLCFSLENAEHLVAALEAAISEG